MNWEQSSGRIGSADAVLHSVAQRAFMSRVYRWMFAGLALTAGVAMYAASNPTLQQFVIQNRMFLMIAQLGVVMALSFMAQRMSGAVASAVFMGYAALTGLTFSILFLVYRVESIGSALLLTAGSFGALSVYASVTKKDLSAWKTFLFMGLIGVVLASVVQIFWHNAAFSFVISCVSVIVFAGLTAYDTQKLRQMYAYESTPGGSLAVVGALTLYLDFINLFLALLRLTGDRRRD